MSRCCVLVSATFWLAAAAAQTPIQWATNARQGVAQARRTLRPVLFYVVGSRDSDESEVDDAQKQTFRDPGIAALVRERFVPVRLQRSNQNLQMLKELGAPTSHGLYLAVVSPDGKLVGLVNPGQAARVPTLARQLTALFRRYRATLFAETLRPRLEETPAQVGQVRKALQLIRQFIIVEADQAVLKLLERRKLGGVLRKQIYQTLAALSTRRGVEALFERGLRDRAAARALRQATPAAAEELLAHLDPDQPAQLQLAYEAVTAICRIRDAKPRGFWSGPNERVKLEEIERVRQQVRAVAQRWRATVGALR